VRLVQLTPELEDGCLARSVVDPAGNLLLAAGSRLNGRYVQRLLARGVVSIYLADDADQDVVSDEALQRDGRAAAAALAQEALDRADRAERPGLGIAICAQIVGEVQDEVWRNQGLAVALGEVRRASPSTFDHSVQVCVLALLVGQAQGLDRRLLPPLTMGALLQDVGIAAHGDLVRQSRPLTPDEFAALQGHTADGYRLLHEQAGLDLQVAIVAAQHHERLDGSGYPRGLRGGGIHVFARIAAVADVYDALVADRPFKPGLPPQEAMGVLRGMAGDKLDGDCVRRLSEQVGVYAVGSPVLLQSGELAVVIGPGASGAARPVVQLLTDPGRRPVPKSEVDLGQEGPDRAIRQVLPDAPHLPHGRDPC